MKKILISIVFIFLVIITSFLLKDIVVKDLFAKGNSRFVYSGGLNVDQISIIIDKETGVMYLWKTDSYKGGLTVMLDKDGKPLINEKFKED